MATTKFKTGAIPTPRWKLAAAAPHKIRGTTPTQFPTVLPPFLEPWLNATYGDCVTAEEAAAIAFYSVVCGLPETKITDVTVKTFCDKYGFLNGANLTEVMDKMISDGFQQDNGYKDGPYTSVDFSNEDALKNAISKGPVKIGMDASALPSGAGNQQGWTAFGGSPGQFSNEDHCTGLWGFGFTTYLADLIARVFNTTVTLPANAPSNGYLHYTWGTIGIVDHAWIMSTCGEAWLRDPTTVGVAPIPPTPVPPVPPQPPIPPAPAPSTLLAMILSALNGVKDAFGWIPGVSAAVNKLESFFTSWLSARKIGAPSLAKANTGIIQTIVDDMFAAAKAYFIADKVTLFVLTVLQPIIDQLLVNLP
jgi:hypothetical protein